MRALSEAQLDALRGLLPAERLSRNQSELAAHARDESAHDESPPDLVFYARTTEEIAALLRYCNAENIPVTPWGAGTSLEANPVPLRGGVSLDLARMDKILAVRPEDFQVTVQPGVILQDLNEKLSKHGLFFPPDPGAPCSIGGMVANNAAGIRAMKYGATKDYVLQLEVVLAGGEVIRCGTRAMRTSSGYDLVHLFIGSEGTLGVFSEVTLKLAGIPPEVAAATASFPDMERASRAVVELVQAGLNPAALELLDPVTVRDVNAFKGLDLPETPLLFLEFSGTAPAVEEDVSLARSLCEEHGGTDYRAAHGRDERDALWEARHHVAYAAAAANPGKRFVAMDVAVPLSKFPETVELARATLSAHGLAGPVFGHAGDGNLHVVIFYGDGEREKVQAANDAIVNRVIELGGTATGEHGVGAGKIHFMEQEHGAGYALMRQLKDLLDPRGILNPGKIFPTRT